MTPAFARHSWAVIDRPDLACAAIGALYHRLRFLIPVKPSRRGAKVLDVVRQNQHSCLNWNPSKALSYIESISQRPGRQSASGSLFSLYKGVKP